MRCASPALDFLMGLHRHGMKPGLERISELTGLLGRPHESCPVVHVAGTNGKGSTAAMIAAALCASGLRTALYTSPHLTSFNERVQVSGRKITGPELASAVRGVRKAAGRMRSRGPLTFFEFTTALAFCHFRDKSADVAVIETGMGGRWDATNVVSPEVSVITSIGMEHERYLGTTLAQIAAEKAGIIKPGRPVVIGEDRPAALRALLRKARCSGSAAHVLGTDFSASGQPCSFDYSGFSGLELKGVATSLLGRHQVRNAACAIAAIEALKGRGLRIPVAAIRRGLRHAAWPGRLEVLSKRPLVLLDGAHNPSAARCLAEALKGFGKARLILVTGVMADKDMAGIFRELLPLASLAIFTRPVGERSAPTALLARKARPFRTPAIEIERVKDACALALSKAGPDDCVCVTGSLFTVAEARGPLIRSLRGRGRR